jgi:hypothetical protein
MAMDEPALGAVPMLPSVRPFPQAARRSRHACFHATGSTMTAFRQS